MKDWYSILNKAIKEYENFRPYPQHTIDWITDKIDWCWKWRKINQSQLEELTDCIIKVMKGDF